MGLAQAENEKEGTPKLSGVALEINKIGIYLLQTLNPGAGWSLVPNPNIMGNAAWGEFIDEVESARGKERTAYEDKAGGIPDRLFGYAQMWHAAETYTHYSELEKEREKKAIAKGVRKESKELRDLFDSGLAKHAFKTVVKVQGQDVTYQFAPIELDQEDILGTWSEFLASTFPRAKAVVKSS